jgi:transcriptional regulator with XRE-family HTH domain
MQGALEFEYRRLVGKRIRSERIWQDLSQDELAAKSGVTRNFVSAIERGAQGLDAYRLNQVADALGLTFADLMATDERRPH